MASRRATLEAVVSEEMAARGIGAQRPTRDPQETSVRPTTEVQETHKRPTKEAVKVRFDKGEYDRLRALAEARGTTAAALVRQAVKDLLRGQGR